MDKVRASKLLSAEEHTRLRQWGRDAAYAARTARLEKTMANNLIKRLVDTRPYYGDLAVALLRVGFGLSMAFAHGLAKVGNLSGFTQNVAKMGIPLPALFGPAAALSEFVGGLLLAIGLFTRPAALCLLITMLVAALWVHADDPFQKKELALAFALVALFFLLYGPGRKSVDAAVK